MGPGFDPRSLPRESVEGEALGLEVFEQRALRERFRRAPSWTPEFDSDGFQFSGDRREAAVLVPFIQRDEGLSVLLTLRSETLKSHAGQVAFPGGRVDPTDASVMQAALREADEEVGLPPNHVEVLGTLPRYTTGTGFIITPVVGLVTNPWELRLSEGEVAEAFEVPARFLFDPGNHQRVRVQLAQGERVFYAMPWVQRNREYFIWGATAAMVRNLYHFLRA